MNKSAHHLTPTNTPQGPYPLTMVVLTMIAVLFILIIGAYVVDVAWGDHHAQYDGRFATFRGSCYWVGDTRTLTRISLNGYTDYFYDLSRRHITDLPDRSWWPVFPLLTSWMIQFTGDGACSGWTVNAIAVVLLVPAIQALTRTRRPALLLGLMIIPYALWLYVGMAEGVFLLFSGLLWLVCRQAVPGRRRRNILTGIGALLLGIVVGLTKPNSIALLPAFLVMGWMEHHQHLPADDAAPSPRSRLSRLLDDANPGWAGLLATTGIALGNGLWFYQTSGYYPFYVLLAQRTLWFKQFHPGDFGELFNYFAGGFTQAAAGQLDLLGMERLLRLSAVTLIGVLALRDLPPRWPGTHPSGSTPLYARLSLAAILALMFFSGQIHAITRYAMGNIFFVVLVLQYVYGREDEPPLWRLPVTILRRQPGAFAALLRIVVWLLGPALTWFVISIGPQLGI